MLPSKRMEGYGQLQWAIFSGGWWESVVLSGCKSELLPFSLLIRWGWGSEVPVRQFYMQLVKPWGLIPHSGASKWTSAMLSTWLTGKLLWSG